MTAMFPCYVIEGIVTIFSEKNMDTTRRFQIENAIQQTIKNGNLVEADNQILSLTWSGFLEPQPQPQPKPGMWAWLFEMAWWILALIVAGIILVLVLMLVVCTRMYRRRQSQKQRKPAPSLSKRSPKSKPKPDVEQLLAPMDDSSSNSSSSSSSSSIATGDNLFFTNGGNDPKNTEYQYHSDDHINESLMPSIDEPIVEEGQEDLSSGRFDHETTLSADRYNGVSYEDRIYQNNQQQSLGYNPNINRQYSNESGNQPESAESLDRTQNGSERPIISESSEEHSRSRHLSRHNKEFRELEESAPKSMASPRHLNSGTSTPASNYSSDIHSNTSRQMSYRDDEVVDEDDDSSYEDVEEEYEIEYASQSERMADEDLETMYESMYMDEEIAPESMYDEVFVDENDPTFSNSNSNSNRSSNINSGSNGNRNSSSHANTSYSNSNNDSTYGSGSGSGSSGSKEENTPLPFLAHNAQLQQQIHKTSFDTLRQKWEQT